LLASVLRGIVSTDYSVADGDLATAIGVWTDRRPLFPPGAHTLDDSHGCVFFLRPSTEHQDHSNFFGAGRHVDARRPMGPISIVAAQPAGSVARSVGATEDSRERTHRENNLLNRFQRSKRNQRTGKVPGGYARRLQLPALVQ